MSARASRRTAAAFLVLGAAYAAACVAVVLSAALKRGSDLAWIDPAAIRYFKISDSVPRNFLYRGGVAAAGALLLLLDAFPERWRRWIGAQAPAELEAGFFAAVAAWSFSLFAAGGFSAPVQGLTFFLGLLLVVRLLSRGTPRALTALSRGLFLALACATALSALAFARGEPAHLLICGLLPVLPALENRLGLRRLAPGPAAALAAVLLAGAFWATVPLSAFRFPLDLSRLPPDLLAFYEMHLNIFALDSAMRLGAHFPISQVRPLYGWAWPLLLAGLNRAFGIPIGVGTFLQIGFALQFVFVACAALSLHLYGGRRLLPALLFSIWVLSWNNSATPALEANHGAARFIGVPLFFLALWSVRRRSFPAVLAAAAPALWLCALINPETALALFASALVFAWFRWRRDGLPARLGRTALLAAAVSPAAIACGIEMMSRFSSGFGGTDFAATPAPFAVVLLPLLVWGGVAARSGEDSPKNAFRCAAAAFLLIWGAYYVNRPWPSNLDLSLYVFSFFAIDLVRASALKPAAMGRTGVLLLVAVAAPLMTGALTGASRDLLWEFRRPGSIFHPSEPERVASGVRVPEGFAAALRSARETWLKHSRPGEPCLMLTSHPIFLSAATCVSSLPFTDPFQAFTLENDRRERDAIGSSPAKTLFIEPETALADPERRAVYARLRAAVAADFRLRARTPFLEVWERRAP